ncbi:hypothetical protein SCP_0508570 [Sparassis crispa]|uniref:Uncharacterized protein n=1 Tax=Sparassis crispa TaxID=139825 RepID=A0A401GNQ1_9APHY|nr:hypothetical protein SCP_0508570 [Sparassis crispa]GBE83800.1 hypothetical protein SCP_0508570 [Sparassis crispa]
MPRKKDKGKQREEFAETSRFCLECEKEIKLGNGGSTNWYQHIAGVAHQQNAIYWKTAGGKDQKLTAFFSRQLSASTTLSVPKPTKIRVQGLARDDSLLLSSTDVLQPADGSSVHLIYVDDTPVDS